MFTRDLQSYMIEKTCVLCKNVDETMNHQYHVAASIYNNMRDWLGMQKNMCSLSAVLRAYRGGYKSGSKLAKMRVTVLTVSVYHSWNMGNIALFKDEKNQILQVLLCRLR